MEKQDDADTVAALRRAAIKAADAADGRGMRGARVECLSRLVLLGHPTLPALQMAAAAVSVGQVIGHRLRIWAATRAEPIPNVGDC